LTLLEPASNVGERAIACLRWYAIRHRSRFAARVAEELDVRGFERYAPTWREITRWSDRQKAVDRPLFPGYMFVRFDAARDLITILQTPGLAGVLGPDEYSPEPIDDAEISSLRRVVDATAGAARPCAYVAGERVRVESGPMAGTEGEVLRTKGAERLVVRMKILNSAISVELDANTVTRSKAD
jgi:transcriptional antiterminator NusG